VDAPKLAAWHDAFRTAAAKYNLTCEPDLNAAFRITGMLSDTASLDLGDDFEAPLVALVERALTVLNSFREREGCEIASLMVDRTAVISVASEEIGRLRSTAMPAFQARLRERLVDLLGGSNIDPQRLVQEAALLADRGDIGEEIERLAIHSRQVADLLEKGGEVGKKLDFLLQEMNRETNTILSKTSGLGEHGLRITELAVGVKSDIEKMREQSLNLE
jgi:uncharacterized protein (TIGR00255 family)